VRQRPSSPTCDFAVVRQANWRYQAFTRFELQSAILSEMEMFHQLIAMVRSQSGSKPNNLAQVGVIQIFQKRQ